VGSKSIKISSSSLKTSAHLDISKTDEAPYIDANEGFKSLNFWGRVDAGAEGKAVDVELVDSVGSVIRYVNPLSILLFKKFIFFSAWSSKPIPVGSWVTIWDTENEGWAWAGWYYVSGGTFNWKIKKVRFVDNALISPNVTIWIDELYFGGGRSINPLLYPTWNPPVKDDASIALYDRHLAHYENMSIFSVEDAQAIGETILNIRKVPHRKVKCKKGAKIWVRPSQVVTLNVPEYGIDSEEWRVLGLEVNWKTPTLLRTTFSLIPKTYMISYKAYLEDTIEGMLRG